LAELTPDRIAQGLTYFVVLLFSLSFHESAHAWMASRLGDDTARDLGRVSLNPLAHIDLMGTVIIPLIQIFGPAGIPLLGWAKPTPYDPRNFRAGELRRGHMLVAVAGPVSNLILAFAFTAALFVAARVLGRGDGTDPILTLLATGVLINVALGIFNLVPLPPLDGSKVATFGLPAALGDAYDRVVRPYGSWILLLLFVTGALSTVVSPVIVFLKDVLFRIALP
jgi:Zn-dependent protease